MCASQNGPYNIGEAAALSGVRTEMILHYESIGLISTAHRIGSGHREYAESDVQTLRFIRRGRTLGFSVAEIAELQTLWQNKGRASADVRRIALAQAEDLGQRIEEMAGMKRSLERLAACCHGDERPECAIIDELAELTGFARCNPAAAMPAPD
jgi:MerR family transcriptional regulator, copper efflux regulator